MCRSLAAKISQLSTRESRTSNLRRTVVAVQPGRVTVSSICIINTGKHTKPGSPAYTESHVRSARGRPHWRGARRTRARRGRPSLLRAVDEVTVREEDVALMPGFTSHQPTRRPTFAPCGPEHAAKRLTQPATKAERAV